METTKPRSAPRTAAQWAEVLADYRRSAQTQEAFARTRGVGVAALRNRLYRKVGASAARGRPGAARGASGFVPVRRIGEGASGRVGQAPRAVPQLVVRWPQGASVELHVAPSTPGVAELIASLLGPCSH